MQRATKEDSKFKRFMLSPVVRAIATVVLPVAVSIISSVIKWNKLYEPGYCFLFILDIVLAVALLLSAIMYLSWENRARSIQNKLDKITSLSNELKRKLEENQFDLDLMKKQVQNGQVDFATWGFATQCRKMCDTVHKFLAKDKNKNNVLVFVSKIGLHDNYPFMGHSNLTNGNYPARLIDNNIIKLDIHTRQAFRAIMTNTSVIYCDKPEEIKKMYLLEDSDNVYGQYLSIPIYKDANRLKVVARMEIVTYNDVKIFDDKEDAEGYCQYYLSLIIEWLAIVYKFEDILRTI